MKTAICKLKSTSPLSFSKYVEVEKKTKESPQDYETRTWKEKMHYDANGQVFIPAAMLKNCIANAAKFLSVQIPGKGKSTYTKNFEAGIMVFDNALLNIHKDSVGSETLFVPSDGIRGGSKRVLKIFPVIPSWEATVEFVIVDSIITEPIFKQHLIEAGSLIGIGRYRPRNNGIYGRFTIDGDIDWRE